MKNIQAWMIAAILFCGTGSVQAQNIEYETKHAVAISYGGAPLSTWARIGQAFVEAIFSGGSQKYENTSWFGSLSAEYFCHVDPSVSIGAIACFSQDNDDCLRNDVKIGDRTTRFITVMPAMKWDYLRRENFGMYMKFAAGYTLGHTNEEFDGNKHTSNNNFFNVQFSLLGVEGGVKNVRGFVELGFGEQGIALAGLRCKF